MILSLHFFNLECAITCINGKKASKTRSKHFSKIFKKCHCINNTKEKVAQN